MEPTIQQWWYCKNKTETLFSKHNEKRKVKSLIERKRRRSRGKKTKKKTKKRREREKSEKAAVDEKKRNNSRVDKQGELRDPGALILFDGLSFSSEINIGASQQRFFTACTHLEHTGSNTKSRLHINLTLLQSLISYIQADCNRFFGHFLFPKLFLTLVR